VILTLVPPAKNDIMDTDELSNEAYEGIIIEGEKFNHSLGLQFGLIASGCMNEKEYLIYSVKLIKEIQRLDDSALSDLSQIFQLTAKRLIKVICSKRYFSQTLAKYRVEIFNLIFYPLIGIAVL